MEGTWTSCCSKARFSTNCAQEVANSNCQGVLEIKCATKYWNDDPKSAIVTNNMPYLCDEGKELNTCHKYYSQVQFQMGLSGRKWCDFVVFTVKCMQDDVDPLIVRVLFNEDIFKELCESGEKFWFGHLLPEIVYPKLEEETERLGHSMNKANVDSVKENTDHLYAMQLDSNLSSGYNCPVCHRLCVDEKDITAPNEKSVGCDGCNAWFHFGCVGMNAKKLENIGENNWFCIVCTKENE